MRGDATLSVHCPQPGLPGLQISSLPHPVGLVNGLQYARQVPGWPSLAPTQEAVPTQRMSASLQGEPAGALPDGRQSPRVPSSRG